MRLYRLRCIEEDCSPDERQVLRLMMAGERATQAYVAPLKLEGQPVARQEREVKRAKDRIMKRLQRGGERHD